MAKTTAKDRLVFTLIISIIIHLIVVLGVSFNVFSPPTAAPLNNLEITLVKQQTEKAPEETDFLAQANNEGGGETEVATPEPTPDIPAPTAEEAAALEPEPVVPPAPVTQEPEPVAVEPVKEESPKPTPDQAEPKKVVEKLTQQQAERKVQQTEEKTAEIEPVIEQSAPPTLSARDLMLQARNEISELQNKLDQTTKALSERPKKRRISARTKEYEAAAYMKAWELKVENIGNLNYPQEAKKQGVNGSLLLTVDINPDGSVPQGGIVISRSSGHKVLDDAAIKIVRIGAPYAAIPDDVLKDNDMLTIIRTWKFESNRGLSTR